MRDRFTKIKQVFIVVKTSVERLSFTRLDKWEEKVLTNIAWFSLEMITHCPEIIYPTILPQLLPYILAGIYPEKPIRIAL